jgi:hypothetical protein
MPDGPTLGGNAIYMIDHFSSVIGNFQSDLYQSTPNLTTSVGIVVLPQCKFSLQILVGKSSALGLGADGHRWIPDCYGPVALSL